MAKIFSLTFVQVHCNCVFGNVKKDLARRIGFREMFGTLKIRIILLFCYAKRKIHRMVKHRENIFFGTAWLHSHNRLKIQSHKSQEITFTWLYFLVTKGKKVKTSASLYIHKSSKDKMYNISSFRLCFIQSRIYISIWIRNNY